MELLERMLSQLPRPQPQLEDDRATTAIWELEIFWWQAQLEGDRATTAIWAQLEGDRATTAIWELVVFALVASC